MNVHRDVRRSLRLSDLGLMLVLVAGFGTGFVLWSHLGHELIPVRDGIGYDGRTYAHITSDPVGTVLGNTLDVHRVQRVVPSLAVHLMLRPFGLQASPAAIVVGFQVLNYALMALASLLWWQITRRLDLSRAAGWVGFLALLVNYGLVKFQGYSPVMTDTAGFLLGLAVVWCLVFSRPGLLPLVAVVGSFTWPTVAYSALGLYVLSRPQAPLRPSRSWGLGLAGALALAIPALAVYSYRCGNDNGCTSLLMDNAAVPRLLVVSVCVLAVWVFLAFRPLLELLTVPNVLRAVHWRRLLVAVVLFAVIVLVQRDLADPSFRTVSRTLYNTALGGIVKPGGFLIAHAVYFGPAVPLLALTWHRAVRALREFGAGPVAMVTGFLLIAITCEARIIMNEWPMFVLMVALVVDRLGWRARSAAVFAVLSVVASRVWFPVFHRPYTGDWRAYPDQYYGMSLGLKMTVFSYSMMTVATVAIALVLYRLVRDATAHPPDPGLKGR